MPYNFQVSAALSGTDDAYAERAALTASAPHNFQEPCQPSLRKWPPNLFPHSPGEPFKNNYYTRLEPLAISSNSDNTVVQIIRVAIFTLVSVYPRMNSGSSTFSARYWELPSKCIGLARARCWAATLLAASHSYRGFVLGATSMPPYSKSYDTSSTALSERWCK
jgi:hypothetical protein